MNLGMCVLCQYFLELSIWGKVAVIAGYILMALLIILWENYKAHRHSTTRLPTVVTAPAIEATEKLVHTITTPTSKENQYDPHKRLRYLLETFRSNHSKPVVYCSSRANRNNYPHHLQQYIVKHILVILNKLRGRVNQSGKEPFYSYQCSTILSLLKVL
jgi:hypothetical protein